MKIAVPYENGQIFQHFGKAEQFKIYEVEDGQVVSSEVVPAASQGHEEMLSFLEAQGVECVICGGIGASAIALLEEAGIDVAPRLEGDADEVVRALLAGEIEFDDGEMEGGCCGHHGEGGCCCSSKEKPQGKNSGKSVKVHYRGTFDDGTQFDSSYDRGEPISFVCGAGQMIPGFDAAVMNMELGEVVQVHLMPEEAYGPRDPRYVMQVGISQLPGSENLEAGQRVYLTGPAGQPFPVTVLSKTDEVIVLDANHEMAGKELNFQIELVEIG